MPSLLIKWMPVPKNNPAWLFDVFLESNIACGFTADLNDLYSAGLLKTVGQSNRERYSSTKSKHDNEKAYGLHLNALLLLNLLHKLC